jgi:putative ABC transport system permease protein
LALAQIRQPLLALNYVGGLAAVLGVSWLLVAGVMRTLRSVLVRRAGLLPRLAGRGLSRPGNLNDAAVVSVSVALLVILALFLLEKNITAQWVESFPPSAPNVFFINIQKGQVEKFRGIVGRPEARLFPLIRGRVVAVNEVPVQRIQGRARQEQGDRLTREFGFTFGEDLLPTDQVISGGGLWDQRISGPQVSAFEGHQKRFGLKVGDRLTVNVLGRRITATVSSVRSIDQSVRQPFFYFYFRPGAIDAAPHTFMGGLHVPSRQIPELENRLARELPNVTVIDLSEVAALTGRILKRLTRIVNGLGLFGVASGLLLLVSSLWTTLVSRVRESVMYRTFGGSPGQVAGVYLLEYALMGVAGTLAAFLGGTAATWVLLRFVFDMSFNPFLLFTGAFLLLALAVMIAVSWLASRSAFRSAPMEVLRYE